MAAAFSTLRDEHSLMTTMLKLLKQEQTLLVSADTGGLNTMTPQKSQLVAQMAQLAAQRHQALASAGFPAQEASMDGYLAQAGNADASALWQDLLALTREAKELNRVNGMLINKQYQNNQTIITAMRTPTAGAEGAIYGPSGQAVSGGASRRFVVG
jgi:flagella synthesis protein FlgN